MESTRLDVVAAVELGARISEYEAARRRKQRLEKALERASETVLDSERQLVKAFDKAGLDTVAHAGRIYRSAFGWITREPLSWHQSQTQS